MLLRLADINDRERFSSANASLYFLGRQFERELHELNAINLSTICALVKLGAACHTVSRKRGLNGGACRRNCRVSPAAPGHQVSGTRLGRGVPRGDAPARLDGIRTLTQSRASAP